MSKSQEFVTLIPQLRERVKETLKDAGDSVYDEDVKRVENDDIYIHQFLRHHHGNMDLSLKMITDALKWRKQFKVRDITESTIPVALWEKGAMYFHNLDKDGHQILHLDVAKRKRGEFSSESQQQLVYLLEQANQSDPAAEVTVLLDFTGAGIGSTDLDFTRFLINCFKFYFPHYLNVLINYEMPWLFNAAWKIIKAWLDEGAVALIKFEGQKTITNYINVDQLAEHMGGKDKFVYAYKPTS